MNIENKGITKVITYGTYDMLHIGHINLLRRAKELGDYLVVGVTDEDYDRSRGKLNVLQTVEERAAAVKELDFVDEVIIEYHKFQKATDMQKYDIDIFAIGDDWVGKFDYLNEYTKVVYLPRTKGISSTMLRAETLKIYNIGVVGTGRIAGRFVKESRHLNNADIYGVMSRNLLNVEKFIRDHKIHYGFDNIEDLLNTPIDAVYIATPHETHFEYAKQALLAGKHVLCEKPITLKAEHLKELYDIADEKGLVLMEAIKTAFFPGFNKLLSEIERGKIGDVVEVRASFSKLITDRSLREWQSPYGGAVNELATYPLLLAQRVLGTPTRIEFIEREMIGVDGYTNIILEHEQGISTSTVGIGAKTEGSAIISGTKGYIYVPAPWWLTRRYHIRFEDASEEFTYNFELDGDGLRYELSEFLSVIQRESKESDRLTRQDILSINSVFSKFNSRKES
ncbi:Gfo/Idh/MocA family oxidoreductase [Psychrobacter sp. HD31]|uniref:Gfo/Idh/MocA family oxidoreductase n=1 Tax=Psychrobacter sp. HD31 TaxID=3112003 RepID=UPI003DA5B789